MIPPNTKPRFIINNPAGLEYDASLPPNYGYWEVDCNDEREDETLDDGEEIEQSPYENEDD